jgi:hypothetical protein
MNMILNTLPTPTIVVVLVLMIHSIAGPKNNHIYRYEGESKHAMNESEFCVDFFTRSRRGGQTNQCPPATCRLSSIRSRPRLLNGCTNYCLRLSRPTK